MEIDWNTELLDQLAFQWDAMLRPRLAGLTDEQLLWEPVKGMWSIRRRADATSPMAVGAAHTVIDFAMPPPSPPPLTTIAWRLGHIALVYGERAANQFGNGGVGYETTDWPMTADGMLALVDEHHDRWVDGVRALGAEGLARPCGPSEGPYAEAPLAALVLHVNREVLHHGAEVALLLDLFHHRDASRPSTAIHVTQPVGGPS
jgi:hypothetical protein